MKCKHENKTKNSRTLKSTTKDIIIARYHYCKKCGKMTNAQIKQIKMKELGK